jgi:hypothetical protein
VVLQQLVEQQLSPHEPQLEPQVVPQQLEPQLGAHSVTVLQTGLHTMRVQQTFSHTGTQRVTQRVAV